MLSRFIVHGNNHTNWLLFWLHGSQVQLLMTYHGGVLLYCRRKCISASATEWTLQELTLYQTKPINAADGQGFQLLSVGHFTFAQLEGWKLALAEICQASKRSTWGAEEVILGEDFDQPGNQYRNYPLGIKTIRKDSGSSSTNLLLMIEMDDA